MSVAQRLNDLTKSIKAACVRAGRDPSDVRILAVSKLQPASLIEEAYAAGLRDFGENYVQELVDKRERLRHLAGIRWHLIGHLQSNKAKQAVAAADFFHALDSEKLVREVARRTADAKRGEPWPVFIETNIDREASKAGIEPSRVVELARAVRSEPSLRFEGLMCIPEPKTPVERMRPSFKALARLAGEVSAALGSTVPLKLSMGMSDDFGVAIEEGSHWVRVGRGLFGNRPAVSR